MHSTTYRGDEKSDEDTDEQRSCRRQFSAQRQRYHGFHRGSAGGERSVEKRTTHGGGRGARGDGRSGGGRGGARGRGRGGGGGKSARMCGRRGKAKGTTRCNISTPSSASEQPRNLFLDFYHLYGSYPDIKMHTSAAAMLCLPVYPLPMHTAHFVWQHAYTQQPSSEQKYPISR